MFMWTFDCAGINFDRITAFKIESFWQLLHCRVWSLCNQRPLQFLMDVS